MNKLFRKIRYKYQIAKSDGLRLTLMSIWDDIKYPPYRLYRNISRLWSYLPIIWRDRDWDQYFFFVLLRHKLKRMEKCFSKHIATRDPDNERHLHMCVLLLDRLIKEEYGAAYDAIPKDLDREEYMNRCHYAFKHKDSLRQQDMDMLCDILRKNVFYWWT